MSWTLEDLTPHLLTSYAGGKAKPLKAAKKGPKAEMDDEDKAFLEKQRAGMSQESERSLNGF